MKTFSIAMVGTWKTNERSSEVWKPEQSQQNVPTDAFPSVHWPLLARSSWRHWPWLRRSQPCQTQCCHHRCSRHRFGNSEKQSARLVLLSLDAETFSRQQEGQQEKQSCRRECSPVGHGLRPFIKLQIDWMDHCSISKLQQQLSCEFLTVASWSVTQVRLQLQLDLSCLSCHQCFSTEFCVCVYFVN